MKIHFLASFLIALLLISTVPVNGLTTDQIIIAKQKEALVGYVESIIQLQKRVEANDLQIADLTQAILQFNKDMIKKNETIEKQRQDMKDVKINFAKQRQNYKNMIDEKYAEVENLKVQLNKSKALLMSQNDKLSDTEKVIYILNVRTGDGVVKTEELQTDKLGETYDADLNYEFVINKKTGEKFSVGDVEFEIHPEIMKQKKKIHDKLMALMLEYMKSYMYVEREDNDVSYINSEMEFYSNMEPYEMLAKSNNFSPFDEYQKEFNYRGKKITEFKNRIKQNEINEKESLEKEKLKLQEQKESDEIQNILNELHSTPKYVLDNNYLEQFGLTGDISGYDHGIFPRFGLSSDKTIEWNPDRLISSIED